MRRFLLVLSLVLVVNSIKAQCTAPSFTVNFSAVTDTTWKLTQQTRNGVCCGSSNCVTFTVFTNPGSELISFDVTNPSPSGSAYYQVNCGPAVSIGTPLCIVGLASPFTITYCKPGGDHPDYIISAGTIVHASNDISIQKTSCKDTLFVSNVQASSITWTSIYPGAQGAYNSYLSCTSGCTSTIVTPGANPPAYVDYMVSGNPNISCGSFSRDTVRVYFVPNLTGVITPPNPVICASSGTSITLTAVPSGGAVPYNYAWSSGPHTQSITTTSAGTYSVTIGDHTKCPKITISKTIGTIPSATFTYGGSPYCKNATNPLPAYTGTGQSGTFTSSPAGLTFVNASTGEVNLSASATGTYTIMNTIAASGGCPGTTATATITINPFPTMTSASAATICSGATVNIPLTSSISSTYTWIAGDNTNTTGESLTTQTTSPLNNTITNTSGSAQVVAYTVTPTSTLAGACVGTPQTVNVTVNSLDDAGFTYSASTNCQSGTNPTATITGLAGGTFSSTAGLVFVSTSTGTVNLAASAIGSYTVTYTTNGVCPNTHTFPINVTTAPSASFSYTGTPYCQNVANPTPIFASGASGGTFTSTAGLVFVNNLTGEIDLTNSTPGTYTVTNTIAASGGCATSTATSVITITQLKAATFSYTGTPYCQNGTNPSPTFTGGGVAGTFTSAPGLSITAGTGLVNLAGSTPGTYTVTNTIAATGGCPSVIATSTITITALPLATFSYTGTPYCQNGTNPLPTYTGGGFAGAFNASSVYLNINPGTGLVDLANSAAGTYTVTNSFAAVNGCPAVSASAAITITTLPIATFNYTATPYCQDGANPTPVLNAGGTNGMFTASPVGLSVDPTAGTVNLSASTAGTYTVTNTILAAGGCPLVTATANITLTALPVANFNYAGTPYCQNGTNPFPTYTDGGVAGVFSAPAGLSINSATGLVNLAASTPGTYIVTNTIAASNGCPVVKATSTITITALPVATFSYTGTPYCKNGSNPSPAFTGGGVAGTFTSAAGLSINSGTGLVNLAASTVGTYTVTNTIAAANGCPPVIATATITITSLPIATFNYAATPYCQNGTNPSPTFTGGGVAGTFTSAAGLSINSGTGAVNLAASTVGTYTVTNTIGAASGCPTVIATSTITISPLPAATFNYAGSPYCQSGTNPSPAYTGGGVAGTFTSGAGLSINSGTGAVNLAASMIGTYTITNTIAAANGCPPVIATATITITSLPIATFNYAATPYCQNGTNPSPTFTGGGVAGTFTSAAGLSINSGTGAVNLAASTIGTYTVTNTIGAASGCPVVTVTSPITINPVATAAAGSPATICSGLPYTLSGAIGGGASTLTWSTNGNGTFDNASLPNATYTPSANDITTGNVTLTITSNDPAGPCTAVSDNMLLTINPAPTAVAGAPATICEGTTYTLSGAIGGGASSLTWTSSGTGTFSNVNAPNATYTPSAIDVTAGTVTLTITTNDPAGPCAAVSSAMVLTITPRDNPAFTYGASTFCQTGTDPTATITGTAGGTFSASSPLLALNTSTGAINLLGSVLGTYSVTYLTAGSCPDSSTVNVTITIAPSASFSYAGTPYCSSSSNPSPEFPLGSSGGTFTAPVGLVIDSISGQVNLANSTAGTYLVTNTIAAAGGCASAVATSTIEIDKAATVDANQDQFICFGNNVTLNGSIGGSATSASWSGGTGTYAPDTTTLAASYTPTSADSTAGTITLTLTTDDPAGVCLAVSDQLIVTINEPVIVNANIDQAVCYGTIVLLNGSIGGSASSSNWSGGTGVFSPSATSLSPTYTPTAADSTAGSVTLTLTTDDPSGVCLADSDKVVITISQPVIVNANTDQAICYGHVVTLNGAIAGSATSATWSGGTGTYTPDALTLNASYTPTAADSTAGSVTLTLTTNDPANACAADSDKVVITISQPVIVNASTDQAVCYGSLVTLNGSIGGSATSATWGGGTGTYTPDATTLAASYTPTAADSTAGSVTLTLTTNDPANACAADSDKVVITISQPVIVNASTDQAVCYGSLVTLNGSIGGSATSATWSGGTGIYTPDATTLAASYTPTAADSTAGSVTLTLTTNDPTNACAADSDKVVITISQPVIVNASTDQAVCYGNPVPLAGITGGSATSQTWTGGTGTYLPDATTLNASYISTAADSAAGNVTLVLTTNDPAGVCPAKKDSMMVSIGRPATVSASSNQTICYGSTVDLSGSIGGSATSATWSGGAGTFTPSTGALNASYTPTAADSAAGSVILTLTTNDPAGVCAEASSSMTLTINRPALAIAGTAQTICYGSPVSLAGAIGGSATTQTWSGANGTFTPNATTLNAAYTPTPADSAAGTITLSLITNDPAGVCTADTDKVIITISQPAQVYAGIDDAICAGSTYGLSGLFSGGTSTITWTTTGSGTFDDATSVIAVYTPSAADVAAGNVTLTITSDDPLGPCSLTSDAMVLTIGHLPTATTGNDTTICAGGTYTVTGAIGAGATTLTWSTSGTGTFSNPNASPAVYTPSAADIAAGSVVLTITGAAPAGPCSVASDALVLNITPLDNAAFNYSSTVYCQAAGTLTPTITGLAGGNFTSSSLAVNAASGAFNLGGSATGTYTVTYTTAGACPNASTQPVTINPSPSADAGTDQPLPCNNPTLNLNGAGSSAGAGITYQWNTIGGNITAGNTTITPAISQPGTYYITVSNSSSCTAVDTVHITQGTITASFVASPISGTAPLTVNFSNTSVGATAYAWSLGDGTTATATNPSDIYTTAGEYLVTLVASAGTCTATSYATISVYDSVTIVIPNVFTPNGDGLNDEFFMTTTGIENLSGEIYNRWGEKVFVFNGLLAKWDGKNINNGSATDGTYYLLLKAKGFDGKLYEKEAHITLFR